MCITILTMCASKNLIHTPPPPPHTLGSLNHETENSYSLLGYEYGQGMIWATHAHLFSCIILLKFMHYQKFTFNQFHDSFTLILFLSFRDPSKVSVPSKSHEVHKQNPAKQNNDFLWLHNTAKDRLHCQYGQAC